MSEHSVDDVAVPPATISNPTGPAPAEVVAYEHSPPRVPDAFPGVADSIGPSRPAASAVTPIHAYQHLRAGDLVAVNRPLVNGREWMSTAAGVKVILAKGERAELLSAPTYSCGSDWVRLRPLGSDTECYMAARFLDLVEANAGATPATLPAPPNSGGGSADYKPGDIFVTASKVNLRTGPGTESPIIQTLAPNLLGTVLEESRPVDSVDWIQVQFPNASGWLAARYTRLFASGEKWIEVNLSSQTVIAWDDAINVSTSPISSGKPGFATPTGTYSVLGKYPARRMTATVRGEHWDIPGVPWVLIFRSGGFYIHGVYWHNDFGAPVSHGCVTLPVPYAEWLFHWAPEGAPIWIHR